MAQISSTTRRLVERYQKAERSLLDLDIRTTPLAVMNAALQAYHDAAADVASSVSSDVAREGS